MAKKMNDETKAKLIYSGELILISLVFLVIGILEMTRVMNISERHRTIFNWITIFGGSWMIIDFLWAFFSKKRRQRICLLDKILTLPLAAYLISIDVFCFVKGAQPYYFYQFHIPSAFIYIFIIYTFEGIYHWYKPIPGLLEDAKKEETKEIPSEIKEENEENKD